MENTQLQLWKYILRRVIYSFFIAWGVFTITFVLLRIGPNSPADRYLATMSSRGDVEEIISMIELKRGLDKPIYVQYLDYIYNLLHGDWGWSFSTSMPVLDLIRVHWIYSFQLVFLSMIFAVCLGILIGTYSAVRQYSKADYFATIFSFLGISIPNFWLGIMLILIFSVKLGFFKTYYDTSLPIFSVENLKSLTLPVVTLGTGSMAIYTRYVRSSVLENLRKDFVRTARAKGLSEGAVIRRHVLRNAMLPVVTIIMFDLSGVVFGGAYLTEIIFGIPGLGQISFNAIFAGDYAVVVAVTLIGAIVALLFNLLADILYTFLDPRIRYE